MKALRALIPNVPSTSLLQFLRSQTNSICFPYSNTLSRPSTTSCLHRPKKQQPAGHGLKSSTRGFSKLTQHRATLKSSILNLDFLSSSPKQPGPGFHKPASKTRSGILFIHRSQGRCSNPRWTSNDKRTYWERLWQSKRQRAEAKLRPNDLPPLPGFVDGHGTMLGRNSSKASNELKLRCTEFDEHGKVTVVNGEFKKSELIAKYGLLPRDLRKIDSSLVPHILIRDSAILINLLHLRCLIKADRVLVLDAYGSTDSYTQSLFMYDLEGKLRQKELPRQAGGLPYEFRALEAVLISVTTGLEGEFEGVREPVVRVLRELEEDIDRDKLRHLLIYSKKLGTFEQRARLVRDSLEELLEADDDLAAMYLTERAKGRSRDDSDHTEVEMLLESYHKVCDEIVQVSGNLVSNIRNTEEIVKAILDANRNSLMLLDLKFSIGTLGIGSGAFIAALYGMNLKNFMEESDFGFLGVSAWSFVLAAAVCGYGLTKLRKVQRVSMWGESGRRSRGSWRDEDPMPALPGETRGQRLRRLDVARHEAIRDMKANPEGFESVDSGLLAVGKDKVR